MRRMKRPPRSAQICYGLGALVGGAGGYLEHGAWYVVIVIGGAGALVSIAAWKHRREPLAKLDVDLPPDQRRAAQAP